MGWFEELGIDVLPRPANSPDLNPIENCWSYVKAELDRRVVHGMEQLFQVADEVFQQMPREYIANLIASMPERCRQVVARGVVLRTISPQSPIAIQTTSP